VVNRKLEFGAAPARAGLILSPPLTNGVMDSVLIKSVKSCRAQDCLIRNLVLIFAFTAVIGGRPAQPASLAARAMAPQQESLQLPSFAIFGLPSSEENASIDKQVNAKELNKFIAGVEKARASKGAVREPNYYSIVPTVFYRARNLFAKQTWTKEEIKQGMVISAFFAKLFAKPELKIEQIDPQSFRKGLQTLRNWFVALCSDNRTLGLMIYTEDQGPFFGEAIDASRFSEFKLLESAPLGDHGARFVVMKETHQLEPIIIGVVNADDAVLWLRRFSGAPKGHITSAIFVKREINQLGSDGYICRLMIDGSFGFQPSSIYLDSSFNLRFYFVSL
jgi:hypothetical protein